MFDLIPFENRANSIFDYFNKMNQDIFGELDKGLTPFRADILDKGDKFLLKADMPGFDKQDIHIDISGDRLTITAEHTEETNENDNAYIRKERRYGSLSRSFDISNIESGNISARYENGVLELDLPKKVEVQPPTRKIEVR